MKNRFPRKFNFFKNFSTSLFCFSVTKSINSRCCADITINVTPKVVSGLVVKIGHFLLLISNNLEITSINVEQIEQEEIGNTVKVIGKVDRISDLEK